MRITGGIYKGRHLKSTPGFIARPTTDKIRQAIFNILMNDIESKTVLDLFAGSGALGIEAISRGAELSTFIEIGHRQAETVRNNLKGLDLDQIVLEVDFQKGCRLLSERGRKFDLIFADPPYNKFSPKEVINAIKEYNLLALDGFLIIEHNAGIDLNSDCMDILINRKFGQTEVTFYANKKGK
jgi:16S rRNA (guanine966-N2)-methyltransferase